MGKGSRTRSLVTRATPAFAVAIFAVALWAIQRELAGLQYRDLVATIGGLSDFRLLAAAGLTAASFLALSLYEILALRYARTELPARRAVLSAFTGYAFSNSLGFPLLTGAPVRYRLYTGWGLSAPEVGRIITFCSASFWIGLVGTAGILFVIEPPYLPLPGDAVVTGRIVGIGLLAAFTAYLLALRLLRQPVRIGSLELPMPGLPVAFAQIGVGVLDWLAAASVLWVLLPDGAGLSFLRFVGVFMIAYVAGLVSHVPGGLGVFEALIFASMPESIPESALLGSLLLYRAVYYVLPLIAATVVLGAAELRREESDVRRAAGTLRRGVSAVLPLVLAATTFVAGLILLFSGATPATAGRLGWLNRFLPLPVIEASHFIGSLAGGALIILAWGIRRRLDAAYHLTVVILAAGALASILKGLDVAEAVLLLVMLAALLSSRREFYRRTSLLSERFTPGWIGAVIVALLAAGGLGLFAFQQVDYSSDLWWRFTLDGDAPRFLRASVGVAGLSLGFAIARLIRPAPPPSREPSPAEIDQAVEIARASKTAYANLVALGDKAILFSDRDAFLMYAVEGRSWVALGDPIGTESERIELAWRFRQLAERENDWAVFYQVRPENLGTCIDMGLSLIKLGEEGRVRLDGFSLEGSSRAGLRKQLRKREKEGTTFELVPVEAVPPLLPELRRISDAWLAAKNAREKGFSLGAFSEDYISRFPVALARHEGRIIGFANVLQAGGHEMSPDLMRYDPQLAPPGVMEYVFIRLMIWGSENGYRWFSVGMAPLAGLESNPLAPLWNRLGAAVFRYGEHFYNFQGLREYKEKFDPVWEPRYMAFPGAFALPRILTNTATLIGGGLRGVVGF